MFEPLDRHDLDLIASRATLLDFDAGRVLLREGANAHEMMIIVSGTVDVTRGGEHIAEIGSGGFFGEMAVLTEGRRNSTVTTSSHVELLHLTGSAFADLLQEVPEIAVKMLPQIAARA
jgi:CRP-like cAMP-binding protein